MATKPSPDDRRNFLRVTVIGGIAVIAAGAASASLLVPPATGQTSVGPRPLAPVLTLGLLEVGTPVPLEISLASRDGWRMRTKRQRVFVLRVGETDTAADFRVFSPVCPHAGCSVELKDEPARFVCPCHGAEFKADGTREKGPAPRDMDSLEASIGEHQGQPWLFVNWQEFQTGRSERVARGEA